MIAAGIDLGGTKIETQIFDASWSCVDLCRIETPQSYEDLVGALACQINWADQRAGKTLPIGIGAAGVLNPVTGNAYTANLPAMGRPLQRDVEAAVGRRIIYMNDCSALSLSEAVFGAGRGKSPVAGLILGTGIGGGITVNGRLAAGFTALGSEFGHFTASAHLINLYGLPIIQCGCGRMGCTETLISGPGLSRIAQRFTGQALSPEQLVEARAENGLAGQAWHVWCDLLADLMITLVFTVDPAAIVIGGGMSKIPNLLDDMTASLRRAQLQGFAIPELLLAQGGEATGARGAAYAAHQGLMDV